MKKVTLTIDLNEDGSLSVSGPIDDKILVYGMLESAKDVINQHIAAAAAKKMSVVVPINPFQNFEV